MKINVVFTIINLVVFKLFSQSPLFEMQNFNNHSFQYIQVDSNGQRISDLIFDAVDYLGDEVRAVCIDDKWGFVNYQGVFVIPLKYKSARYFSNGIAYVGDGEQYFFIDKSGAIVSEKYDTIYGSSKLYFFRKDGLYGFLDSFANVIEAPVFQKVDYFFNGKISVKYKDKWMSWSYGGLNYNDSDLYFYHPELIPVYNEYCEEYDRKVNWRGSCSEKQMLLDFYKNIKYPKEARENDIQGKVISRCVINENGEVVSQEILRGIGKVCDDEVLSAMQNISKCHKSASTLSGEPVKMILIMSVPFILD